jgi:uncharacterized membrane protein
MVLLLSDAEHVSFLMDAAQAADRLKGTTMTKEEFLNALGNKLSEDLSGSEIASELRYYEGYIDAEVSRGKSEEEATEQLGDPILIARNIVESPRNSYGYREATYEQGYEEATYQQANTGSYDTDSEHTKVETEEYAPDYEFGEDEESEGPAFKEKKETSFDNGFFDRRPDFKVEKVGSFSSLFRNLDGSFNWGCLTTLLIAVLVVGLIVVLVTKVVITAWPVILVAVIFGIVFSILKGRS